MRLLTWNIMHGGGGTRLPHIGLSLLESAADVIAIMEFRTVRGGSLRAVLADHGWRHQAQACGSRNENTVFIASQRPILAIDDQHGLQIERPIRGQGVSRAANLRRRLLTVDLEGGTSVTAAHIPDAARGDHAAMEGKAAVWQAIIKCARARREGRHIVLGDLNTGRHRIDEPGTSFSGTALLGQLTSLGYVDAWRAMHGMASREGSWRSHAGSAFRLDHALVSQPLAGCISGAQYDQNALKNRVSDHAPLIVDLIEDSPESAGRVV